MRSHVLVLAAAGALAACAGCTTASLERNTVSQIQSVADYRSEAALHCLAAVAADPGTLPGYATLIDGTTSVKDTASLSATTNWTRAVAGFASQVLTPMVGRSPNQLWTLDPVADHTRLEAMRCACRWALGGPERACADCPGLLADPLKDPSPGPHFGVADRLARLPAGWLHVGTLRDVPAHACYKAHCRGTWVWVTADDLEGLAEFVLVLNDIATIDVDFGATTSPPVLVTLTQVRLLPPFKVSTTGITDADVLKRLQPLTRQTFDSPEGLLKELEKALTPDQFRALLAKGPPVSQDGLPYSKQVVYSDIRVIDPAFVPEVKNRIAAATAGGQPVAIPWAEWAARTTPYHGTRTNVKPDGVTVPPQPMPTRPLEAPLTPDRIRIGGNYSGIELIPNPFPEMPPK
jgi:hypothetical protein